MAVLANRSSGGGAVDVRYGLFPAEIFIIVFGFLTFLLYAILDVPLRSLFGAYLLRLRGYVLFYLVGLVLALLVSRFLDLETSRKNKSQVHWKTTLSKYRGSYLKPWSVLKDLRFLNCLSLMFFIFVQLKHLIPHVNPILYDDILLRVDRWIFGGQTSGEWLHEIIGFAYVDVLSTGYVFYYYYMFFMVLVLILQRDDALRQEFFSSFVLVWFVGILIIYAFPSLGPCFYIPENFADLPASRMTKWQAMLWDNKLALDQFPKSEEGLYIISGFPSLHLAVPIVGALYLRHFSRLLAWLSWVFVGVTIVTTLYFGWHYLLDDVGSFLLVFGVMGLTRFIFKRGMFGRKRCPKVST